MAGTPSDVPVEAAPGDVHDALTSDQGGQQRTAAAAETLATSLPTPQQSAAGVGAGVGVAITMAAAPSAHAAVVGDRHSDDDDDGDVAHADESMLRKRTVDEMQQHQPPLQYVGEPMHDEVGIDDVGMALSGAPGRGAGRGAPAMRGRGGGGGGGRGRGAAGVTRGAMIVDENGKRRRMTLREAAAAAAAEAAMAKAAALATEAAAAVNAPPPPAPTHYNRLEDSDIQEAMRLGLLSDAVVKEISRDAASTEYGVAYEKRGGSKVTGCGTDVFPSQKALQERCKQFAMERGFQLYVAGSSSRPDGGGNVKYRCKKLHGQQFFDPTTPADALQCPFYINGFGLGPSWKVTRACLLHNHYKFIGSRLGAPGAIVEVRKSRKKKKSDDEATDGDDTTADGAAPSGDSPSAAAPGAEVPRVRAQRNTTLSTNVLCRMVNEELAKYPSVVALSKLDGKMIKRILLSRGHTINHMMASRIKRQIQVTGIKSIRTSFQKLRSYLELIVTKNPGTQFQFDVDERGVFKRAMVLPNTTMHALRHCQKVVALDHVRPMLWRDAEGKAPMTADMMDDEHDDAVSGVYLYAATKDHNDQVVVFALALVNAETQENWMWFLHNLTMHGYNVAGAMAGDDPTTRASSALINWNEYTVFAGRTNGLQAAVQTVWPHACLHLCVRRLVDEELVLHKKFPLPEDKKQRIYELARCESEVEYKRIRVDIALTNEACVQFLDALPRSSWVKYAFLETFKRPTFGIVSSDLSAPEDLVADASSGATDGLAMKGVKLMAPVHAPFPSAIRLLRQWFGDMPARSYEPLEVFNRYFMKIAENFHARRKAVEQRPPHELVGFVPWPLDAAALELDTALKIRLDELFAVDPSVKRKPGPRPKLSKLLNL
ncbi:hypothetical protein P43SY_002763 [Pythium insidiosum]|uniref:MULE transposase domain-containing protein n=1 Tax=Pythium insidiosum TaxID=114742 RepID=A0AAD5LRF6_PYTIN|nr:hypothetical protein P43SY_002763 [Pythium insidiosum]